MESQLHNLSLVNAIAAWTTVYLLLRPRLARESVATHLTVLLVPHLFRYLGLIALIPSLFDMRSLGFSDTYHAIVGWGDFASGLLALAAIWLVQRQSRFALAGVWLFNVIGTADFLHAGLQLAPRISDPSVIGPLGWPVFTVYLPIDRKSVV